MNFQGLQARFNRLHAESIAWKLLRADNAPHILAFLEDLFSEASEVPYSRARVLLETELSRSRELGIWQSETTAGTYLNQWIRGGWLRELDDSLTRTDASETAVRFCRSLDERTSGTTASHLRIVQEAVRDLTVALSPNVDEQVALLEAKKAEIQQEIDNIGAGVGKELSEAEQRERIREIYLLASVLTGDFRRVEDDIRQMDKSLRIEIIEGDASRGEVLLSLMEKEALVASTDAGSAFESFFQLLCDQNRSTEIREQLRNILQQPAAEQLKPHQQQFLGQLMRELSRESDRVFRVRRRTEEGLRAYIESGTAAENRAVDGLLSKLERTAVSLREADCNLGTDTGLDLPVGPVSLSSPESMRLRSPDEKLDTSGVEERANGREPSEQVLDSLDSVQVRAIAVKVLATLEKHGPLSISGLTRANPLESGLEELVAYLRVAKAVNATVLDKKEEVIVPDRHGIDLSASIPTYVMSRELFPANLDDLVL
ncbi:MAG: DUF3375 domain-containing protein [Candidatus Azotimanducaceae bacterium WSBS_2022_MAG_OTU7]